MLILTFFETDSDKFPLRFVTIDELWVHHFIPESKQESKQWKHPGSPLPKNTKMFCQLGRLWPRFFCFFFFYSDGIFMVDYLLKGQTISGTCCALLLRQVRENTKGNSVKMCCFTRTMLQLTCLSLLWLQSLIVALH